LFGREVLGLGRSFGLHQLFGREVPGLNELVVVGELRELW
jgi:hypothetical protein